MYVLRQMNDTIEPRFVHVAYGLRKDGSMGSVAGGVPVLEAVVYDARDTARKPQWHWSDGTVTDGWTMTTHWGTLP